MFRIHGLQGFRIGEEWLCIRRPEHDQYNLATVLFQAMLAWFRSFGDERFAQPVVWSCGAMTL